MPATFVTLTMMKKHYNSSLFKLLLLHFICLVSLRGFAQTGVGIGTTTPQAALDVTSTTGGFLPPRMSLIQRGQLSPLVAGLVIYQHDSNPGLYLYNGAAWVFLGSDNLGSHNATQKLNLQNNLLVGADNVNGQAGTAGLRINGIGHVGIGTVNPTRPLQVGGRGFTMPSFIKIGAGDNRAPREWELGVDVNTVNPSDVSGENFDFVIRDATNNKTRLLIDFNEGNVGIGTSTPTEKLDVDGNLKVSQNLLAKNVAATFVETDEFRYKSPQTRTVMIPATAFVSSSPGSYPLGTFFYTPNSSTRIPVAVYLAGGSPGTPGYIVAPVSLPESCRITSLTLVGLNRHGANVNTSVTLSAVKTRDPQFPVKNENLHTIALQAQATLPNTNDDSHVISTISLDHIVRNEENMYQLTAALSQNTLSTQVAFVKITYTVGQPD